jgi:hypothetical protein
MSRAPAWRPMSRDVRNPPLLVLKALLLAGLLAALVVPGMHQFTGQALRLRVIVYLAGLVAMPAGWAIATRLRGAERPPLPYPVAADVFLLVPFFFDLTGNSFQLYARVDNYDDAAHLLGVACLTLCGAALMPRTLPPAVRATMAAGIGVFLGVLIELVEWVTFSHPVATGFVAYRDTVGDLAMDALGCVLGAAIVLAPAAQRHRSSPASVRRSKV